LQEEKCHYLLSFPIADKQEFSDDISVNSTTGKTFYQGGIYFFSIIANLILS